MNVFLVGFMGSGKSYMAKKLSLFYGTEYIDLDNEIEQAAHSTINQIFENKGESYFRDLETSMLKKIIERPNSEENNANHSNINDSKYTFIACGGGTPCFNGNIDLMNEHGLTVWINPPIEIIVGRLEKEKSERPLIKELSSAEIETFVNKKISERKKYYSQSKIEIKDPSLSIESLFKSILHA